jgi:hypothetical protein
MKDRSGIIYALFSGEDEESPRPLAQVIEKALGVNENLQNTDHGRCNLEQFFLVGI